MNVKIVVVVVASSCLLAAERLRDAQNPAARLAKFVDELPIPPRLKFDGTTPAQLDISMKAFAAHPHRDLPEVTLFGYNGMSPGPTIEVESGQTLTVQWHNDLPETHIFALPKGAEAFCSSPTVRTVTHLHGAEVVQSEPMDRTQNNDGWPDAWISPGEVQPTVYPNQQSARTLWYHDHSMGTTGRNVAAGLFGTYLIHDAYERSLNLPEADYDIPLVIATMQVQDDGSLAYTDDINIEFWGNAVAVNGKIWPSLTVEPRRYRFRLVNAATARSFGLKLVDAATRAAGPAFHQIGSDGGFLPQPVLLNDPSRQAAPRLTLFPAERADIIIDFSAHAGQTLTLTNNQRDLADDELPLAEVMQFRVLPQASQVDTSQIPSTLKPIDRLEARDAKVVRRITMDLVPEVNGSPAMFQLNGKRWDDPIEERPQAGTTEVWEIANTLIATHPFHIHLVQFQVIDRQLFDVEAYLATGEVKFLDDPVPPAANEMGWKDTVRALPQMLTRVIMRFPDFGGYYLYHCHILEHEDMDMMRPFQVVK